MRNSGLLMCLLLIGSSTAIAAQCGQSSPLALQVLGSGGPIADDARASTSYLLWIDGRARIMIDAGSGSFLRYGESGARFDDLNFVGLSHFHTDHVADFVGLLKTGLFSSRQGELVVAGPSGAGVFPGLNAWLKHQLWPDDAAYAYLGRYLRAGPVVISPVEVSGDAPVLVYHDDDVSVTAISVPHGIVPAIAFRVAVGETSIVFAGDQNGSDTAFARFARGAELLVMHLVIPEGAGEAARALHAEPTTIGRIARQAGARRLLLSHFMARSLAALDDNVALVESASGMSPVLASDLACLPLSGES